MKSILLVALFACLAIAAPVPPARLLTDPVKAVKQFDAEVQSIDSTDGTIATAKARLAERLKKLQQHLERQDRHSGEAMQAGDLIALLDSCKVAHPIEDPLALLHRAKWHGKYARLTNSFVCPHDRYFYADKPDFGWWPGGPFDGQMVKPGFWVYVYPRWFVWENGPSPSLRFIEED